MLKVHSYETFGTSDGPGIRLVVFLQGCNFRCLYCQNPDTWSAQTSATKLMSAAAILKLLQKEAPYFKTTGGLTVSGGEPTLQAPELIKLFRLAKNHGIHSALDTNGSIFTSITKKLYDLTDLLILDVKHIDDAHHRRLTGASNVSTLKTAHYREQSGLPLWLRYVLVPGFTDRPEHLRRWAQYFAPFRSVTKVEILPYHTLGVYKYQSLGIKYPLTGVHPPTPAASLKAKEILSQYLKNVIVR